MTNKDLIKQYVDTGIPIPESQLLKLSPNDKKTYIRKRLIANGRLKLKEYEFNQLNDEQISQLINKGDKILESMYNKLSPDNKKIYINNRFENTRNHQNLDLYEFFELNDQQILKLSNNEISGFLARTLNPKLVVDKLGKKFIEYTKTHDVMIYTIIYATKPQELVDLLISSDSFLKKMEVNEIIDYLFYTSKPEEFIKKLGRKWVEYVENLNEEITLDLFMSFNHPKILFDNFGSKGIKFFKELDRWSINKLCEDSKNPDEIIEIFNVVYSKKKQ